MFARNIVLTLLLLAPALCVGEELKPFVSDGCSMFPDGSISEENLWFDCCYQHDLAYWRGGTYEERVQADKALQQCVAGVGEESLSFVMEAGVRVGGSPYWPTGFRWGYGWPYLRGYKALTDEETRQVEEALEKLSAP
ncbi:FAD-binding oxidoreductase [Hahella sp. CR1]|uniref:FAD-binding oxidoreductase n=1 Tax=Hahella sp. CR1 TaxID=2992807 RepID=UPI002441140C|nr:FAD-binding oxidoreductase [Hahella sp. CR1]MDG9669054.1 FAD-binding oxidoreductase [Hahella sp. CR1]